MTKLFDALVAHNTGRCVADIQPAILDVSHDVAGTTMYQTNYVYRVDVQIGARLVARHPCELEDIKRRAWASINHHVYEEFRPDLAAIRDALYMHDTGKALNKLDKLWNRMYKV